MQHYNVSNISGRRVNPDDGLLEYCVQWEGHGTLSDTWEPRCNLTPNCTALLAAVDAHEAFTSLQRIENWAKGRVPPKRKREEESLPIKKEEYLHIKKEEGEYSSFSLAPSSPILHGIIVHNNNNNNNNNSTESSNSIHNNNNNSRQEISIVALGERLLTESTSRGLNPTKKKKLQGQQEYEPACDPALILEKQWKEQHAVSFMHTCATAVSYTPAVNEFNIGSGSDICHDASSIEIYSIAPAALVKSGQMYNRFTSCEPLIGHEETERLRRQCNFNSLISNATQQIVRGRRDQLVVRYFLIEGNKTNNDRTLHSMPLSVFRQYYPQLLLDFLLRHSLIMESA